MTTHWRRIEARILRGEFGGKLETWSRVQDRAFRWYLRFWSRYRPGTRADYRHVWRRSEIEWLKRTLQWAGVKTPTSERTLFRLDRKLTYQVTRKIDAVYPDSRRVLRKLRRMGFRLYLVSGMDSTYAKGALEASGLGSMFDQTYPPDKVNSFKGSFEYWKRVLRSSRAIPETSFVVDDRPRFLQVPARLGLNLILVGQGPILRHHHADQLRKSKLPSRTERILGISELPGLLENISRSPM